MVRSAFATERILAYITALEEISDVSVGLLYGQSNLGKDYVVHACITPSYHDETNTDAVASNKKSKKLPHSINDVNENIVADHAKYASRMLPGGMYVLGIFIITDESVLSPLHPKIKSVLLKLHQQLNACKYLCGSADCEKLVLNYCKKNHQYSCKTFDVNTTHVSHAEFKVTNSAVKWQNLECKYEIDFMYHIKENCSSSSLKKHLNMILDVLNTKLNTAIFLYNGEVRDPEEYLENVNKKKVSRKPLTGLKELHDEWKTIQISIFELCNDADSSDDFELYSANGQIRIQGQVASKIWMNSKSPIKQVSKAVNEDVMRSLATRLEMHWDSLTEEEDSEDVNTIHEPPRRVFLPITPELTVSDYLFPGENSPEILNSLKDFIGLKTFDLRDVQDIEGQADLAYYTNVLESESEVALPKLPTDTNKFMYLIGLGVALFVLILSLLIHFIIKQ